MVGIVRRECEGARVWKGPHMRKEHEKWGTPIFYDAGEVGPPPLPTFWWTFTCRSPVSLLSEPGITDLDQEPA
jgi:hypothetical protein